MATNPDKPLALITGASLGIGQELARVFAQNGHDLVLVARSAPKLRALADELAASHGVRCTVIAADLATTAGPRKVFDQVEAKGLEVGVLVNNAGVLHEGPMLGTPLDDHLHLLALNVVAVTALTHLFAGPMVRRGSGRILNVSSLSAFQPVPRLAVYAASKAFVLSMTEALSVELQGTGVTASAMCPGFTDTDMVRKDDGTKFGLPLVPNMTPQQVAADGYRVCMQGVPVHVNGVTNQIAAELMRVTPRWLQRAVSGAVRF